MRKFARVILVLALVLGVSVSAFAAGAPKSQEQRLVPINGEVAPGDYVGWTEERKVILLIMSTKKTSTSRSSRSIRTA